MNFGEIFWRVLCVIFSTDYILAMIWRWITMRIREFLKGILPLRDKAILYEFC